MKTLKALLACLFLLALFPCFAYATDDFLVQEEAAAPPEPVVNPMLITSQPAPSGDGTTYEAALASFLKGDMITALNAFASLGQYADSTRYEDYLSARLSLLRSDPLQAAALFEPLGGFLDSPVQARLCAALSCHRYYDGSRFGYVDEKGRLLITPQFDWAEHVFQKESASLTSEESAALPVAQVFLGTTRCDGADLLPRKGQFGLLRRDGVLVVPIAYDEILWALDGLAAVRSGADVTLFDLTNGEKIGETYAFAGPCREGYLPVEKDGKWGYLGRDGSLLAGGFCWDSAQPFQEGLAGVSQGGLAGFINPQGEVVIPLQYEAVAPFSEGLSGVCLKKRWGFITLQGDPVIKPAYQAVRGFVMERCAVKRAGKWGAIDAQGKLIVPTRYDEITDFDPLYQRAWMRNNKLWGLLSRDGSVVLKPSWATFTPFGAEGLSAVSYKGDYGYIDIQGVIRISNQHRAASPFSGGLGGLKHPDGRVEYLSKWSRGFAIDSDFPSQPLYGFIEGRHIQATPVTQINPRTGVKKPGYSYDIGFSLWDVQGNPITPALAPLAP